MLGGSNNWLPLENWVRVAKIAVRDYCCPLCFLFSLSLEHERGYTFPLT